MKGYKNLIPIALVACMLLSFYMLFDARSSKINEYNAHLSAARKYAEDGVVVDALKEYNKALEMDNTVDINVEVGNLFVENGDVTSAIGWGESMIESFPKDAAAYEFLLKIYYNNNDFHRCYALYNTIEKRELVTETVSELMNNIKYVYYFGVAYENVGAYSGGYCAVNYEGKWGLVSEIGQKTSPTMFDYVGAYVDGLAPVLTKDGEYYFIDNEGNKKMTVKLDGKISDIKSVFGGVFAVNNGKTWAFYNTNCEKLSKDYEDVSVLANTVVAVNNKGKWTILNDKFEKIIDKKFDGVVQDDRGIIYRNGVIFVNKDDEYSMIDINGNNITKTKFYNAKLFLDNTYAAVETDKGWTFVNAAGEIVFKDLYFDDANSFLNGFAAVKKNGLWGYIDIDGKIAIDFQFEEAKDFNKRGCAFVKTDGIWQLLKLYSKNYES